MIKDSKALVDQTLSKSVNVDEISHVIEDDRTVASCCSLVQIKSAINEKNMEEIFKLQNEWTTKHLKTDGHNCLLNNEFEIFKDCFLVIPNNLRLAQSNFPLPNSICYSHENSWYVEEEIGDYIIIRNRNNLIFQRTQSYFPPRLKNIPVRLIDEAIVDIGTSEKRRSKKKKPSSKKFNDVVEDDQNDGELDDKTENEILDAALHDLHVADTQPGSDNIDNKIGKIYNKADQVQGCYGDSGGMEAFAEVTLGSNEKVINMIKRVGFDPDVDIITDLGSGYGLFLNHFAAQCKLEGLLERIPNRLLCIGIEIGQIRYDGSETNKTWCMEQGYINFGNIRYIKQDFKQLRSLDPTTFVYIFNTGMPPETLSSIACSFNER